MEIKHTARSGRAKPHITIFAIRQRSRLQSQPPRGAILARRHIPPTLHEEQPAPRGAPLHLPPSTSHPSRRRRRQPPSKSTPIPGPAGHILHGVRRSLSFKAPRHNTRILTPGRPAQTPHIPRPTTADPDAGAVHFQHHENAPALKHIIHDSPLHPPRPQQQMLAAIPLERDPENTPATSRGSLRAHTAPTTPNPARTSTLYRIRRPTNSPTDQKTRNAPESLLSNDLPTRKALALWPSSN